MPTDLTAIDLATLSTVQGVIVAALRNQCCLWEQQSSDAAADGRLSNALMLEQWAFAADLLTGMVSSELTSLFLQVLNAKAAPTRSFQEQVLDALTIEVASAQEAPELVAA